REQRPVAAEDDDQIRLARESALRARRNTGERRRDVGEHADATPSQRPDDALRETRGTRLVALHHQADRADAPHHHLRRPALVPRAPWLFQSEKRVLAFTCMPRQSELFPRAAPATAGSARAPLAERMRPRAVDEFVGQRHLLGPGRVLRDLLAGGRLESLILSGPPGTGKTTLARLLADASGERSGPLSAPAHPPTAPRA